MANVSISSESFKQAMQPFQEVVQAAAQLQEQSVKALQEMLSGMGLPAWQKTAQVVVNDVMAVTEKNTEVSLEATKQNLRTSMELWWKAFDPRLDEPQPAMQDGTMGFWQTLVGLLHTNAEAVTQANEPRHRSLHRSGQTGMWPANRRGRAGEAASKT